MRIPATITLCALLASLAPLALAQDGGKSRRGYQSTAMTGDSVTLPFVRWGNAILLDNVMIDGNGPFRFLFDTGAEGAGRLDRKLVEALDLPESGSATSTTGLLGQSSAMTVHRLDALTIGGVTFNGVTMLSRDYSEIRSPGLRPIHGILGYHLFNEYLMKVDYPARTITLTRGALPEPDGKTILPIISDDDDPEIEVSIAGHKSRALLDTGAMGPLAVSAATAMQLKFAAPPEKRGEDGGVTIQSAKLDGALQLGAIEFANPKLIIAGPLTQTVIGIELLAELAVTYDQPNARVRIERPAPRKRYGVLIGMSSRDGPLVLKGVDEGSVAAAAGIKATDRLIAVNGIDLAKIDREKIGQLLDTSPLTLQVERDGKREEIRMSLD